MTYQKSKIAAPTTNSSADDLMRNRSKAEEGFCAGESGHFEFYIVILHFDF
jgi:hypothetical protein